MHAALLEALDVDLPRIEVRGRTYRRTGRTKGTYYTMVGPVTIERAVYCEDGQRNAPTVDAISLRVGAIGRGWLPQTATAMAHHVQQGTSREAAASAKQDGRLPYARAKSHNVAHLLGEQPIIEQADIECRLAREEKVPEEACSISVSLDRVSVPMEEPRAKPRGRPRKNAPKKFVQRKLRMAYVGTVTLHDTDGAALRTLRYGCMPKSDPGALCESMANDVYAMTGKRPDLTISLLADGAPEMWSLLEEAFPEQLFGPVTRRIDF